MSQLQELQAAVDSTVATLLANTVNHDEIIINYEIQLERAQDLLRQVNNAVNMSHGVYKELLNSKQAVVLIDAIDYIIRSSNDLVGDLNGINGSGIHEVTEPTRYNMIVASILEAADRRYVNDSFWRITKNRFKKIARFTDAFLATPNPQQKLIDDHKVDELNLFPPVMECDNAYDFRSR